MIYNRNGSAVELPLLNPMIRCDSPAEQARAWDVTPAFL
jgi:hypothetical protein